MKKIPVKFLVAFTVIVALLVITTVSGVVANPAITSNNYDSHFEMKHIGITLLENEKNVGYRDYFTTGEKGEVTDFGWKKGNAPLFEDITNFKVGETYTEEFKIRNSGTIDEYVRIVIYKYWVKDNAEESKVRTLNPDFIELGLLTDGNWILDNTATTKERVILYYKLPLPVGEDTDLFMKTLKINNAVLANMSAIETKVDDNHKTMVYTYDYNGYKFCVEMEADAVQTHNAVDAIKSAWGKTVTINADKSLSLVN